MYETRRDGKKTENACVYNCVYNCRFYLKRASAHSVSSGRATVMQKRKIHSCTANRLAMNERPSIHEKFRVNGTQSWITGCTGKPEMGSRMTSSRVQRRSFNPRPGINWVIGTAIPLIFSQEEISDIGKYRILSIRNAACQLPMTMSPTISCVCSTHKL